MNNGDASSQTVISRRWYEDQRPIVYIIVDLKCDGGDVRRNALRNVSAIAAYENGGAINSFSRNLTAPEGSVVDKRTMALYREHPEAWKAISRNADRASVVMSDFVVWVKSLSGQPVLVATPLTQTTIWLDSYLRRFTKHAVHHGPYEIEPLFYGGSIDIMNFVMGVTGCDYRTAVEHMLPSEWRGHRIETHDPCEDVLMHSEVFFSMLKLRKTLPQII
jgi:hypothetical protein